MRHSSSGSIFEYRNSTFGSAWYTVYMLDDTKSKISELERELYAKDFSPQRIRDILPHGDPTITPTSWDSPSDDMAFAFEKEQKNKPHYFMKKFALVSAIFFIVASAVASFIWWQGSNVISGENIKIEIFAPLSVPGGESFETKLMVTNGNKVAVEKATLFIEYPAGFYSLADKTAIPRISKDLGSILPGQSVSESVSSFVYGEENTQKEVNIILEYRMVGSNATIKKLAGHVVKISSSPITIKLDTLKEVSSGQEVEFVLNINSNISGALNNVIISAEYPTGFTFRSASPEPSYGTNIWAIGTLSAQGTQTIKVRGVLEGHESEQKVLRISVGTPSPKDERIIGVVYNGLTETISITKPLIRLDIVIDGNRSSEYVSPQNRSILVDVSWQNSTPTKVTDAVIEVRFSGIALNRYSIYASDGGFYRSSDNTIVWEKTGNPSLAVAEAGARGMVSFGFSPIALGVDVSRGLKNPQITLEVIMRANRISETSGQQSISTLVKRVVKFDSDLRLTSQALYFSGPFKNTGPIPPKADTPTTYTVKWSVRNSSNSISNAVVKTTLPIYVTWLGQVSPNGEDVSYNASRTEVTWNVGRISSGGTREAAFQVSLLPSLSQLNIFPLLTGDSTLVGQDDFTKSSLSDRKPPVTTNLLTDPTFGQNQGAVVQ